jgi:cytochrome oxidase assembly protein ShyY1
MQKSLINQLEIKIHWKVSFIIVLSIIVLVKLGFWQLDRAEQKQQMQRLQQQRKAAIAQPIESLATADIKTLNYQKVHLTGIYLNDKSIYISNKFHQGKPGFEVITAFKLKSNHQIVLLSRGWVALPFQQKKMPKIDIISGEQQLIGTIHLSRKNSFFLTENAKGKNWPVQLHHFQMNTITELFQTPVIPYVVRLEADKPGSLLSFWPTLALNVSNSIAYAIQWFMMAFALFIVSIIRSTNIIQLIQSKKQ